MKSLVAKARKSQFELSLMDDVCYTRNSVRLNSCVIRPIGAHVANAERYLRNHRHWYFTLQYLIIQPCSVVSPTPSQSTPKLCFAHIAHGPTICVSSVCPPLPTHAHTHVQTCNSLAPTFHGDAYRMVGASRVACTHRRGDKQFVLNPDEGWMDTHEAYP